MAEPILRAVMGSGKAWDDPSEDLILELLRYIEAGDEQFMIIERAADASGQTYAQVVAEPDGGWTIERKVSAAATTPRIHVPENAYVPYTTAPSDARARAAAPMIALATGAKPTVTTTKDAAAAPSGICQ